MFCTDKITEFFCICDDFCHEFDSETSKKSRQGAATPWLRQAQTLCFRLGGDDYTHHFPHKHVSQLQALLHQFCAHATQKAVSKSPLMFPLHHPDGACGRQDGVLPQAVSHGLVYRNPVRRLDMHISLPQPPPWTQQGGSSTSSRTCCATRGAGY